MKISVIIPIYNEEEVLSRCVDSILLHNTCEFELILVDDGSTDRSVEICNKYVRENNRCKIIRKDNGGLVSARNTGIKASSGDYITFVDADDWVDPLYLDDALKYIDSMSPPDIFVWKMVKSDAKKTSNICMSEGEKTFDREEALGEMFEWNYFRWELAGKFYKREIIDNFFPDEKVCVCEDLDRNWVLFRRAEKVMFSDKKKYYYYSNPDSITNTISPEKNNSWKVYAKILCDEGLKSEEIRRNVTRRAWESAWNSYRYIFARNTEDKRCMEIEETVAEFYKKSDVHVSYLLNHWGYHKSFRTYAESNVKHNLSIIKKAVEGRKRVFLYGCGGVSYYISQICFINEIEISGYVVSENVNSKRRFLGKQVISIQDYKPFQDDVLILAMKKDNSKLIRNGLKELESLIRIVDVECES